MIKNDIKKRNWTMVLYDDSCAKDWEEYLNSTGIPYAYARHDKDKTEIGELKAIHTHVMICFDGPVTYHNAKTYADRIGAKNGVVQPVGSVRGMVRYFCHKDNPDKYQYNEDIIQCRNGFDPSDYFNLTATQQKALKRKVTTLIRDNDITEYGQLIDWLMDLDESDMYDIATQNTFYFSQYIKSKRNMKKNSE